MKTLLFSIGLLFSSTLYAQELRLKIINPHGDQNTVTYDVVSDNLINLLTMQFSIVYDGVKLSVPQVKSFAEPTMTTNNFGLTQPGVIRMVWFHPSLLPITYKNGTVLFQLEFNILQNPYGKVCYSEEPLEYEFSNGEHELLTISIVDDCYPDPFQINLNTVTEEPGADALGLHINPMMIDRQIVFTLDNEQTMAFHLLDMQGKSIQSIPTATYISGQHALPVSEHVIPGMYILTTTIHDQPVSVKIVYP